MADFDPLGSRNPLTSLFWRQCYIARWIAHSFMYGCLDGTCDQEVMGL